MLVKPPIRGQDDHGAGHWQAPRGDHLHNGVDPACYAGSEIYSICDGTVTKFGYPYGDDLTYRYVEVTHDNLRYRYFYVQPNPDLQTGDAVKTGDLLGILQDISTRYPGITQHLHFEIMDEDDNYINPEDFI